MISVHSRFRIVLIRRWIAPDSVLFVPLFSAGKG